MNDKSPKYWIVARRMRELIERGQLGPGDALPSLAQVQADYKVSLGTADKAFGELEKEGLIVREQGRGTFVASRRRRTGLIGFLGDTFAFRRSTLPETCMAEAMERALEKAGKSIVLLKESSPAGWDQVEGILVVGHQERDAWLRRHHPRLPVVRVLVGSPLFASVVADEAGGAAAAVEHLFSLGHTRIGCLFNGVNAQVPLQSRFRFAGYHDALRAAGIEPKPGWSYDSEIAMCAELGYRRWAYLSMRQWLRTGWEATGCTALLAQNDLAAIGVIEALHEAGRRVPHDVSVVGFDGTEICECVSPSISAVEIPLREISVRGVQLLLDHLEGAPLKVEQITLPTRLRQRASTAPPPARIEERATAVQPLVLEQSRMWNLVEGVR